MKFADWRVHVAAALLIFTNAAYTAPPQKGLFRHKVVAGDTLESIGARYLLVPAAWRDLQAPNHVVDPDRLKRGSVILLPRLFMRTLGTTLAKVEFVQGQTTSSRPETPVTEAPPLAAGDTIAEGMRIQVPKDGYLRLRLADGSTVRVLAESDVELKRLRAKRPAGPFESIIDVRAGKVESEVTKQPKGRVFEIHAPGAVASVRGTQFAVSVHSNGQVGTAVSEGVVALQPKNARLKRGRATDVKAGQGAVIDAEGKLGLSRPLPASPDLTALPEVFENINSLAFTLNDIAEGGGYEVRVARDEGMQEVLRNGVFRTRRIQFTALDDGPYTVGIRALDSDLLAGPEARRPIRVNARPEPPLYQSPPPGGRTTSDAGQLICSEVVNGITHLQVSSRADFRQPEIDQPQLESCRFGMQTLAPGSYFWRVASLVALPDGTLKHGPFAAPQSFIVAETPNVTGIEADEGSDEPTLRWGGQPGQTFRGQLARDAAFTQIVLETGLTSPSWTLTGQVRGIYFVRIEARDASGLVGPFSPVFRVRIGSVVRSSSGSLTLGDGSPVERP